MTTRVLGISTWAVPNAWEGWWRGEPCLFYLSGTFRDIITTWGGSHEP